MEKALATSRWAKKEEIFETRYLEFRGGKDADFLIGETDFLVRKGWFDRTKKHYFVGGQTDQHILACMGARGGKGTSIIVPNLLFWHGSCVVVDPKGENATIAATRRGNGKQQVKSEFTSGDINGLGQKTLVLDPFAVAQVEEQYRATFNPLDAVRIDEDEAIDEAGRIADAIVVQDGDKDSHWNESARYLIKGLILHVLTDADFEGQRNLISVRKLLVSGDWLGSEAIHRANTDKDHDDPDRIFETDPFEMLWLAMIENRACEGVISGVGRSIETMADRERSSVLSTAARNTEFIESPPMRRSLERSSFALSELKTSGQGVSLFLSLPNRYMSTHHRWLRMLVTLTLDEMEKIAHQPKCGYPVLMVLDEFPGLGRMKRIEDATAQIPGYGVKLLFVCQSLSQLKEVYKDNWETFIACSGIALFAANQDEFTLKYLTRRLGESEITRLTHTTGQNRGYSILKPWTLFTGGSKGTSEQLHKRALLNEDEVSRTFASNENKLLVFVSGMQPMALNKTPYHQLYDFAHKYTPHPDHPAPPDSFFRGKETPEFWADRVAWRTRWIDSFSSFYRNDRVILESSGYRDEGNIAEESFSISFWILLLLYGATTYLSDNYAPWAFALAIYVAVVAIWTRSKGIKDGILFLIFIILGLGFWFLVYEIGVRFVWSWIRSLF